MQITDYESGNQLRDIDIVLTAEEAKDLMAYLSWLLVQPDQRFAQLSEVRKFSLLREITLSIDPKKVEDAG